MKDQTFLNLPAATKRMARMAAARRGLTMSQYIADLVTRDCVASGVAGLVETTEQEVRDERLA